MVWWLFQNLVITTALAAVVAAVCRVTRIGPVARHALWLVVLVKFVTPPLVVWPWAVPDPLGLATIDVRVDVRRTAGARSEQVGIAAAARSGHPHLIAAAEIVHAPALVDEAPPSLPVDGASVFGWFLGLWAIGSVAVSIVEAVRLARLARRVNTAGPPDPFLANRVTELSARLRLRPVPVVAIDGIASPMVWCLGRPRLLWPADLAAASSDDRPRGSSESRIDGVIVHELAHVKRGDHLVGWLELLAGIVWWWNPLFWFVRSSLREQAELACDAWVISAFPDERRAYAEALLALSGATGSGTLSRSMPLVGIRAGSRRALERRLVMIMKGRAPLRLPMAGVLALALMAAATLPAWATASQQQVPPPPPPVPVVKPSPQRAPAPLPLPVPVDVQGKPDLPSPPLPVPVDVQVKPEPPPAPPQPTRPVKKEIFNWQVRQRLVGDLSNLPADSRQLIESFDSDRKTIREEADRKIDDRRAAVIKALQDLQEQYTKAGKLDEAVAIRDYLRAGGPRRDDLLEGWVLRR